MFRSPSISASFFVLLGLSSSLLLVAGDDPPAKGVALQAIASPECEIAVRRIATDRTVEQSLQEKLRQRVTVKFEDRGLEEVLTELSQKHSLPLAIDRGPLADNGVPLDLTLSLDVSDVTLQSALRLILTPLQLQTILRDEVLTVTTAAQAGEALENRVYDVDSLLFDEDFTSLIEVVTSCVSPDSWDEVGGPCSIREMGKTRSLVVRATQEVHEQLVQLLADLNQVVNPQTHPKPVDPVAERNVAIRKKLVEACSIHFEGAPIGRALAEFAAEHALPLWVDRPTLADEGISFEKAVNAHLTGVRVESALNHLLRPFELAWIVEDEVLKVTTRVKAGEILEARVYDVRDLATKFEASWPPQPERLPAGVMSGTFATGGGYFSVRTGTLHQGFGAGGQAASGEPIGGAVGEPRWLRSGYDLTELIELVTSTIENDSWDEVGGAGSVREFRHTLVIRQTEAIHAQIERMLQNLRAVDRRHAEQQAARPADPQELKRVVYEFAGKYDYPVAELARLIPETIAPDSWKSRAGTGTLHLQPTALVITQTPAIHKEIVKLLYEVVLHTRVE